MIAHQDVHIIDDDQNIRRVLASTLSSARTISHEYGTAAEFLEAGPHIGGCVVTDVRLPDMDGIRLVEILRERKFDLPILVMTGYADVDLAVRAMKAGAADFLAKPFSNAAFLEKIETCLAIGRARTRVHTRRRNAAERLSALSGRESQVLRLVIGGKQNKCIAWDLGISIKTVEVHRAHIMEKTGASSIVELARMWEISGMGSVEDDASMSPALALGA
ncbi:response regulator transcription factor [Azospirillum isscasi]|uniref:Response regulator n=1 Tax=Azospirillum isscasi TaxID=3053926 RepID=A0ABU0WEU3_9PROT|nr:response regulator [Azospirillum isscasi]MDQ2102427.1 response regulator [Azospirillum isscasi]